MAWILLPFLRRCKTTLMSSKHKVSFRAKHAITNQFQIYKTLSPEKKYIHNIKAGIVMFQVYGYTFDIIYDQSMSTS